MATADEIFAKARGFDERKHPRLKGRFSRKQNEQPTVDPVEGKKKEIFDRYQAAFDKIDEASPITGKTTKKQQQLIMADRARAKAKLSLQMYRELERIGAPIKTEAEKPVGDEGYIKPHLADLAKALNFII